MNNNVIPFHAPVALSRAGYRDSPEVVSTVTNLFQVPCEARLEAATNESVSPDFAVSPGDVWTALCSRRVLIHYQPQYDIATGVMVAAEALVRLIDTEGQLIYPDRFIDLVEQSDLIVPLGRAVIEQVCADLASCRSEGISLQRVAINLSGHQLSVDTQLLSFIDQVVTRYGLQHTDLEFELTERQGLTPHGEGTAVLRTLAQRGARVVIDDFGMGYSSVEYLTLDDLPVSAIKLDRALVARLPDDETMQCVVQSLLTLAAGLGLEVIAEGVETNEQNEYLAIAGCSHAQGFGYAMPMGICELQEFIVDNSASNDGHLHG